MIGFLESQIRYTTQRWFDRSIVRYYRLSSRCRRPGTRGLFRLFIAEEIGVGRPSAGVYQGDRSSDFFTPMTRLLTHSSPWRPSEKLNLSLPLFHKGWQRLSSPGPALHAPRVLP